MHFRNLGSQSTKTLTEFITPLEVILLYFTSNHSFLSRLSVYVLSKISHLNGIKTLYHTLRLLILRVTNLEISIVQDVAGTNFSDL